MPQPLPPNVHISSHPCLQAKLSQLRDSTTKARETKALVHEISLIVGCEALAAALSSREGPPSKSHLGYEYSTTSILPETISLVPILRSGLGMIEGMPSSHPPPAPYSKPPLTAIAIQTLLPSPVPIHHLGLFREPSTLQPVEYYNNLPYHSPDSSSSSPASSLAILLDPVIATGGTSAAAIQTLKEWGVQRILVIAVLGAEAGVLRAAREWGEGTEVWIAGIDDRVNEKGMIIPGLGDVGDRLFGTIGK